MSKVAVLDVKGNKIVLKFGKEYLLGRKSKELSQDIEIDDPSVDIKHSIIDLREQQSPQLFDIWSKNGTFLEDVKITRLLATALASTNKIRFGSVDTSLQLLNEGDSGFIEERLNSSTKDASSICNTPDVTSSESRLKNSLKNSLTSTPNASSASTKSIDHFLIPSNAKSRTSLGSNTSARSADSFYIPETQHVPETVNNKTNNSTKNESIFSNQSKKSNFDDEEDFCIPETQEVAVAPLPIPLSNHARVAFPSNEVNETISQEDRMPSSQFRICTQDFNGSEDELSNQSGDILANVPLSMIIPPIHHEPVQVDDFLKIDNDLQTDDDKEMSALQWSKITSNENIAEASVTPDELFDVVGSVTSDLIKVKSPKAVSSQSQCSTPDIFANFDDAEGEVINKEEKKVENEISLCNNTSSTSTNENEAEKTSNVVATTENNDNEYYPPTQPFFKPIPMNEPQTKPITTPLRNINKPSDDSDFLPETQVFIPPAFVSKTVFPQKTPLPVKNSITSTTVKNSPQMHVFTLPKASPKLRLLQKTSPSTPQTLKKPEESSKSLIAAEPINDDDLPPTQVFTKEDHIPPPVPTTLPANDKILFSSTLVDAGMELSEMSFKTKFNKLLDSDDDEMDEVVAPELVKQMRKSLEKSAQPDKEKEVEINPSASKDNQDKRFNETENNTPNKKSPVPAKTPDNKNKQVTKTAVAKVAAVNIDEFLLTPDFLGKVISKNTQLQREAEINWRNKVLEKNKKELFENGDMSCEANYLENNSDFDESQDSFSDLLPKRREKQTKPVSKAPREEKPTPNEEKVCVRITRRKSVIKTDAKQVTKTRSKKVKDQELDVPQSSKSFLDSANEKHVQKEHKTRNELKKVENGPKLEKSSNKSKVKDVRDEKKSKEKESTKSSADVKVTVPKEKKQTRASSRKEKIEYDSKSKSETQQKAEEKPTIEPNDEKLTRSRPLKRNAEVTKSSSKASNINKLDEVEIVSNKPSPRLTRLKSSSEVKKVEKKTTLTKSRKNNESIKKANFTESAKKESSTIEPTIEDDRIIDLTDSEKSFNNNVTRKRKSQEKDDSSKPKLSISQSSTDSSNLDRTLRRKKKLKIAMTSCSPTTREILVRYSGRIWEYTENPKECDVLILEAGNRTYKLLVALARGVPVVKVEWLKEVISIRSAEVPFNKFLFDEPNFQKRHKFIMKDVLQSARNNPLFRNLNFMMTPSITPKPDEMKDIIICAGGTVLSSIPSPKEAKEFYLVSEVADRELWHRYRRANPNVKVVKSLGMMESVMQQSLKPLINNIL